MSTTTHTENQSAGYDIEDYIRTHYYVDIADNTYTGEYDAETADGIPVQIKGKGCSRLTDNTIIELGSIFRLHKKQTESGSFIMDITSYSNDRASERIVCNVDIDKWNAAVPDGVDDELAYSKVFEGISNSHDDDDKWNERRNQVIKDYDDNHPDTPFRPYFKRDHRNQKRIQTRIRIKDLKALSTSYETYHEDFPVYNNRRGRGAR